MSSPARIVVLGSGGHAKVIVDLLRTVGKHEIIGCLGRSDGDVLGAPVLGGDELLHELRATGVDYVALAVGDNELRLRLGREALAKGFEAPSLVHPAAVVAESTNIGAGSVLMAGAVVNAEARIGRFCIVNTLACVEHDCVLEDGAHLAPRAAMAGGVHLGEAAFMGVGSCAVPQRSIGAGAIVGAGSVVIADIPPHMIAAGVPARPIRPR